MREILVEDGTGHDSEAPPRLSQRQRQMIELAAAGLTDKAMARQLEITVGTLRAYWDRLRRRLDAQSRTEAVARFHQSELAQMAARRDHLEGMLNSLPMLVWTAKPCGAVNWVNAAFRAYAGEDASLCLGPGCRILMLEEDLAASSARWSQAQLDERPYEAQVRFRCRPDGGMKWHHIRLSPLRRPDGRLDCWVGAAYEVNPSGLGEKPLDDREPGPNHPFSAPG